MNRSACNLTLELAVLGLALSPAAPSQLFAASDAGFPQSGQNGGTVTTIDANLDGYPDLLIGGTSPSRIELWINDGHGKFTLNLQRTVNRSASMLAVGDLNGDGRPDFYAGSTSLHGEDQVFLATTAGSYREVTLPFTSNAIAIADVDRDGDLDVFSANSGVRILLGDGQGNFVRGPWFSGGSRIATLDADSDGDVDLFVGGQSAQILLNNGRGGFPVSTNLPALPGGVRDVASGDVDGDGRPDLVVLSKTGPHRQFLNSGAGRFVDASTNLPARGFADRNVVLSDVNDDGSLDVVIGEWNGQDRLWFGIGAGRFVDATRHLPTGNSWNFEFVVVDLEQDGDQDFVSVGSKTIVLANFTRQLSAPTSPRLGQAWTLELARNRGIATRPGQAIPILAAGPRRPPLQLPTIGNLMLDPATAVALPPVGIATPTGTAQVRIQIPSRPILVNQQFSAQALVLELNQLSSARFTNAITATVSR